MKSQRLERRTGKSKLLEGIAGTRQHGSDIPLQVPATRESATKTQEGIRQTQPQAPKKPPGFSKTQQVFFRTLHGFAETLEGIAKTQQGFFRTLHGFTKTLEGISKTQQGFFRTLHGFVKTPEGFYHSQPDLPGSSEPLPASSRRFQAAGGERGQHAHALLESSAAQVSDPPRTATRFRHAAPGCRALGERCLGSTGQPPTHDPGPQRSPVRRRGRWRRYRGPRNRGGTSLRFGGE